MQEKWGWGAVLVLGEDIFHVDVDAYALFPYSSQSHTRF